MKKTNVDPDTGEIQMQGREGWNRREDLDTSNLSREEYYANVPFLRTPYNYNRDAASNETAIDTGTETPTQQQFKEDADINVIVERFGITGDWPENFNMPTAEVFVETMDFQTAQNAIVAAREEFQRLPAQTREQFDNDPHKLMRFLEDPDNRVKAEKLGLVNPRTPTPAPPGQTSAPASSPAQTPPPSGDGIGGAA